MDVGAGQGAFCQRLLDNGFFNIIAIEGFCDFKIDAVTLYKNNLNDPWMLDIEPHSMDAVFGLEIIEHMENPFHFLREIKYYLKPEGRVFISTPNTTEFVSQIKFVLTGRLDLMIHPDHRSPIFPDTLRKICEEVGFEIEKRTYDVDILSIPSKTIKGKIMRPFLKLVRSIVARKHQTAIGNSAIWVLRPIEGVVYRPPKEA